MTPLGESVRDRDSEGKDRSTSDIMEDGGEETETAPEADDDNQDDSVTRCICDYLHDDGYMICCDKCFVWQHVVCMGLDRNNIPDEYLCEKCHPRFVDRKRAKALQRAREKEIFLRMHPKNNDSSDDDEKIQKPGLGGLGVGISSKNRKPLSAMTRKLHGKKSLEKKMLENKKVLKKNYKRRGLLKTETSKPLETSPKPESQMKKLSPRKNIRRKSLSVSDAESEDENTESVTLSSPPRSWIDNYEEAVTNHYSPELRARLQGAKLPSNYFKPKDVNGIRCNVSLRGNGLKVLTANNFIPQHTPVIECRGKYMLGGGLNGPKPGRSLPFVLVHRLSQDIEVVVDGKTYGNDSRFCRRADGRSGESNAVVKHHLEKGSLHLYIVASRNIEKNQEILLPPLEHKNGIVDNEMSIQEEIREIRKVPERKMVNGTLEGRRRGVSSTSVKRRIKRENVKKKEMAGSSSDEDENERAAREIRIKEERERLAAQREERAREAERERKEERPPSPRKTRFGGDRLAANSGGVDTSSDKESVGQILEQVVSVKQEQEQEELGDQQEEKILEPVEVKEEKVLEAVPVKEEKIEEAEQEVEKVEIKESEKDEKPPLSIVIPKDEKDSSADPLSPPPSMTSPAGLQKSPGKANLGLPDQSGLIVGVNTINYDVSIRNKPKTREEKKMEQIMKAIEAMERAEARKRSDGVDSNSEKPEKKRRRSNSVKTGGNSGAADSALDQSSADEGSSAAGQTRVKGRGRGRRQTGGGLGARRRSRAKSGDSSALSEAETPDDIGPLTAPLNTLSSMNCDKGEQFKFPRHKKSVVEPEADDDVSKQYLRGSRSPPGIANHLLRSARTDKNTQNQEKKPEEKNQANDKIIGCSAKKRWLRAAMSEDTSEENHTIGNIVTDDLLGSGSPAQASPEPDYTPLKKRRLATYNEMEEQTKVDVGDSNPMNSINNLDLSPPVNDKLKSLPNGLKKRLISNLVLEAVLDKAMEDYGGDKKSLESQSQASVKFNEDVGEVEHEVKTKIENCTDSKLCPIETEELNVNITGDKPKSFKDRKKEAIMKAERVIKQNEQISSSEKNELKESSESQEDFCVPENTDPNMSQQDESVIGRNQCGPTVVSKTPDKESEEPTLVPEAEPVSPAQPSPQTEADLVETKVPEVEEERDVPVEEEEFCSTPLMDEEMTEVNHNPSAEMSGPENLSKSPSPMKETFLEKVSPRQMLEAVSPMDTSTVSSCPTPGTPVFDEPDVSEVATSTTTEAAPTTTALPPAVSCTPVPMQHKVFKSFFSTDLSVEDIDRQLEARRELLVREAREESTREDSASTPTSTAMVRQDSCASPSSEDSRPGSAGSSEAVQQQACQVKKRVSLADYKKRKQQGGGREERNNESSIPSFSNTLSTPGSNASTLTLPTPPLSLPSLPDLPGLESFSARGGSAREPERSSRGDRERRSEKVRSRHDNVGSRHTTPSPLSTHPPTRIAAGPPALSTQVPPPPAPLPTPDHPREDLTERLRKEFGLNIDESDGEGSGGEGERRHGEERLREVLDAGGDKRETRSEENEKVEKFRDKPSEVKIYSEKSRDGYREKSRDGSGGKSRDTYSDKSRDGYSEKSREGYSDKPRDGYSDKSRDGYSDKSREYSDKSRDSYSDKSGYRDTREAVYRDNKPRDSYGDKSRDLDIRGSKSRGLSNHGGARRPPHPSSPTNCAPGRGLPNQGGARRPPHHPSSPTRRNSQDSSYSHQPSYYKNDSSRRSNFSRNFYT